MRSKKPERNVSGEKEKKGMPFFLQRCVPMLLRQVRRIKGKKAGVEIQQTKEAEGSIESSLQ